LVFSIIFEKREDETDESGEQVRNRHRELLAEAGHDLLEDATCQ
jgi:hypothetical protein